MKKRLRKKRHLGEFIEYGFGATFHLEENLTENQIDEVFYKILELVDKYGLECGGGFEHFYVSKHRGSVTPDVMEDLCLEFSKVPHIKYLSAGPLTDSWHGWDDK